MRRNGLGWRLSGNERGKEQICSKAREGKSPWNRIPTGNALGNALCSAHGNAVREYRDTTAGKPLGRAEILQQDQNPWSEDQLKRLEESRNILGEHGSGRGPSTATFPGTSALIPIHPNRPRNENVHPTRSNSPGSEQIYPQSA